MRIELGVCLRIAKGLVAVVVVWWLLASGRLDFAAVTNIADRQLLLLTFVFSLVSLVLPVVRWWILVNKLDAVKLGFWEATWLTWFGYGASLFLPGAAAGDGAKLLAVAKRTPRDCRLAIASTILIDRLLGLYSLISISAIAILLVSNDYSNGIARFSFWIFGIWIVATVGGFLLASRHVTRIFQKTQLDSMLVTIHDILIHKRIVVTCIVISAASSFMGALALWAAVKSLGINPPVTECVVVAPLVFIANCLPISPGGIGVGEATSDYLFRTVGIEMGAEAMVVFRSVTAILSSFGLIYLLRSQQQLNIGEQV